MLNNSPQLQEATGQNGVPNRLQNLYAPNDGAFDSPNHVLMEVNHPEKGRVLSSTGTSANLTRSTRVVSERVVFVDNIADTVSKNDFIKLISQYATRGPIVDVRFLTRTKGSSFAFIEFENEEDGRDAIQELNHKDYTTNSGKVLELRASKAENPTESVSNKNLYVKGIPRTWSNDDLKRRFRGFGAISHCRTLKRPGSPNENSGVGFVHFFNALDAAKAIEEVDEKRADPSDPGSPFLEVKFARAKKPRARRQNKRGAPKNQGAIGRGGMPNWGLGRGAGGRGRGRNMRGGRGQFGGMYPPAENNEVWAKMVELMQNMSMSNTMWQNPYNVYGGTTNYQNFYPTTTRNGNTPDVSASNLFPSI